MILFVFEQRKLVVVTDFGRGGDALNFLDVFKTGQFVSVADDVDNSVDSGVEFVAIDVLVKSVSVVVSAG